MQASESLDALLEQERGWALPDDLGPPSTSDADPADDLHSSASPAEASWLGYIVRLTNIVAQHLPDLWLTASEQLTALATVSDRAKQLVEGSITLVASSLRVLLEKYRCFICSLYVTSFLPSHAMSCPLEDA